VETDESLDALRAQVDEITENLRLLTERTDDIILKVRLDGTILWASPSCERVLGWRPEQVAGHPTSDFLHPEDVAALRRGGVLQGAAASQRSVARLRRADGSFRWFEGQVDTVESDAAEPFRVTRLRDVEDEVRAEHDLVRARQEALDQRARLRMILDTLVDPILMLGPEHDALGQVVAFRITEANAAACAAEGTPYDRILGASVIEAFPAAVSLDLHEGLARVLATGAPLLLDDWSCEPADGGPRRVYDVRATKLEGEACLTWRDVTERAEMRARLELLASTDSLTGMVNRSEALERLTQILQERRVDDQAAVLFCDLDRFKGVNDSLGHAAGDEVLRVVAQRIRGRLRADDFAARIGGDELLVVLSRVSGMDSALVVAQGLADSVGEPVAWRDSAICVGLSVGVCLARPGESVDDLIARADRAMYEAKRAGRHQVVAVPQVDLREPAHERAG